MSEDQVYLDLTQFNMNEIFIIHTCADSYVIPKAQLADCNQDDNDDERLLENCTEDHVWSLR